MAINIKELSPLLNTILIQQQDISARLGTLILTLKREPEPVEPTLRMMLSPIKSSIDEICEVAGGSASTLELPQQVTPPSE